MGKIVDLSQMHPTDHYPLSREIFTQPRLKRHKRRFYCLKGGAR